MENLSNYVYNINGGDALQKNITNGFINIEDETQINNDSDLENEVEIENIESIDDIDDIETDVETDSVESSETKSIISIKSEITDENLENDLELLKDDDDTVIDEKYVIKELYDETIEILVKNEDRILIDSFSQFDQVSLISARMAQINKNNNCLIQNNLESAKEQAILELMARKSPLLLKKQVKVVIKNNKRYIYYELWDPNDETIQFPLSYEDILAKII